MGRPPCCDKSNVKRGLWTAEEDMKILAHISTHGVGNWTSVPEKTGLKRCGKSCRLRWTNYLRPDLKHDSFTPEEEELIIQLHATIGSRWSMIAAQLPGRTDNDVKNLWSTKLRKKLFEMGLDPVTHKPISQIIADYGSINLPKLGTSKSSTSHHHHLTDSLIRSPSRDLIKKAFQIKSESLLSQLQYQDYHNINSINIPMPTTSLNLNCGSHSWEVLAQLQAMQLVADQQPGSIPSYSCTKQHDKSMEVAPPALQYSEAFYNPKMEARSSSPPPSSFNWCEFLSDDAFLQYPKQEDGSIFAHNTDPSFLEEGNHQNQYGLMEIGQGQVSEETSSISACGEASSRSFVDELLVERSMSRCYGISLTVYYKTREDFFLLQDP